MHSDISVTTYTDFGQNAGRYVAGETNALLQHIRTRDGGIYIGDGQYFIPLEQGMPDFSATFYVSTAAALSPSMIVTVGHNGEISSNFSSEVPGIGSEHAIKYQAVGSRYSDVYANWQFTNPVPDWRVSRQSKIFTDVTPYSICESAGEAKSLAQSGPFYHVGSGTQSQSGSSWSAGAYQFSTGGISTPTNIIQRYDDIYVQTTYDSSSAGVDAANPLPYLVNGGDSGSPVFVYDGEQYKLWGCTVGVSGNLSIYDSNPTQYHNTIDRFNKALDMSSADRVNGVNTVYLGAVTEHGELIVDNEWTMGVNWYGTAKLGEQEIRFCGVKSGLNTWADLSDLKDTQNWYAYNGRLNLGVTDLFFTENLQFSSSAEQNRVELTADIDTGIGYVEFSASGESPVHYTVASESGEEYCLNTAGYVVRENASVHLQLTNSPDYMREWRKTGEGDLYIEGSGDNNILLNLGGSGKTYLNRESGYAAYNVLANGGTTVVLKDVGQIERDFTFGNGGATLDMNGNDMDWYTSGVAADAPGFTVNALTEDAIIANYSGSSTLVYRQSGDTQFVGSFRDASDASLRVVYAGGGSWELNSIFTRLEHAASGLDVADGRVILSGTHTVHGVGSDMPSSGGRYQHEDDWHYADAAMNVTVRGKGVFELGSHARLSGDVTVEQGGTYVMREGVRHAQEYVEGGLTLEDTAQYREFYGHKGNTHLAEGAVLKVEFSEGTTANNVYGGDISGAGSVSVDTASGSLTLTGNNTFTGSREIIRGTLIAEDAAAAGSGGKWLVGEKAAFALQGADIATALQHIDSRSAGVLALTQHASQSEQLSGYDSLFIGALTGHTVEYGTAGTQEALNAVNGAWRLGGGGGDLVVHYALSGNYQLILGDAYTGGTVTLTNAANNFSATLLGGGGSTLRFADAAAAENVSLSGGYGIRLTEQSAMSDAFEGALLLQDGMGNVSMTRTPMAALGADGDVVYAGDISLGEGGAYRFGGITGQLTVNSSVGGAHDLTVDNQGYENGTLVLNNISNLTGKVTVQGSDSRLSALDSGSVVLKVTRDAALNSAAAVELGHGATLDIAGTAQQFNAHFVSEADSALIDSSADGSGSVTFALAADETLDSVHGVIDAAVRMTNGRLVLQSTDILKRTVDGMDAATLEMRLSGEHTVKGGNYTNLAELHVSSGSLTAEGAPDAALIRVDSGAQYATGSNHSSAFVLGGDGLTGAAQRGALSLTGNVTMSGAVTFVSDTTLNVVEGGNATISGAVNAGGHALTKSGAGNLTISGALTNTHEFCIESGTLTLSSYTSDGNSLQLSGGGELSVTNWGNRATSAVIADNSRLALGVNGDFKSNVSGSGSVCLTGVSAIYSTFSDGENGRLSVELQGGSVNFYPYNTDSTHSGGTTVDANQVWIYRAQNLGRGEVVQKKGTIYLFDGDANLTIDSLRGSGSVTKYSGAPVLNLTGAFSAASHVASYKGGLGVSVSKSGLYTQEFGLTGETSLPSAVVNGGTLRFLSNAQLSIDSFTVASGATLALGGTGNKSLGSGVINGTLDLSSMVFSDASGGLSVKAGSTVSFGTNAELVLGGLESGGTYSVFDLSASGASLSGWTQGNISVRSTDSHGATFTLLSGGKLTYTAGSHYHDLIWNGGETGSWNTQSLNWRRESDATAQAALSHDSVIFRDGDYRIAQAGDILLKKLTVSDGANLSLENAGGFSFSAEQISVENQSTLRITDSDMGSAALSLSGGSVVEAEGAKILQSDIALSAGSMLRFTGSSVDTINYNSANTITVSGSVVDFGTTRQTIGGWNILLSDDARLIGIGSSDAGKSALDYHENGTISVTSGSNLISAPIRVRSDKTLSFDVAADAALNVEGLIRDGGSIVKDGAGVLELSGSGSYSGSTTVKAGVLRATAGGALGSSSLEIQSGAIAEIEGDKTLKGNVTVHENALLHFTGSAADSIDYSISESRNLTVNGGVVDIGGTRQTMGNWNLMLSGGAAVTGVTDSATSAQAVLDYNVGGTITSTSGNNTISSHIRVRNGQTLVADVSGDSELRLSGMLRSDAASSTATFTKEGAGTLVMSRGEGSLMGLALNINAGRIIFSGAEVYTLGNNVSGSSGTLEVAEGARFINAAYEVSTALVLSQGAAAEVSGSRKLKENISVNRGATLTFTGSGSDTLEYGNDEQYSKLLIVDGGTVDFGSTRQTMAKWEITLKNGAELKGEGGTYSGTAYSAALDFNRDSTITAEGAGNLISANIRLRKGNERTLTYQVAEGADLEVSGRMHADTTGALGKVTKDGAGKLILSGQTMLNTLNTKNGEVVIAYTGAGGSTIGNIDGAMSGGTTANGTLRIAENAKLKVTGNFWSRPNTGILLEEGAELNMSARNVVFSNRSDSIAKLTSRENGKTYYITDDKYVLTNGHAKYTGANVGTLANCLTNSSVENAGSGKLTVNNAANSITDVYASAGDMAIMQQAAGLNLDELVVASGKTVSAYTGTSEIAAAEANVTVRGRAEFGKDAVLNANLTLASGSSLSVAEGGLAMGSTLTLQQGITLDDTTLRRVYSLNRGESVALFTGVDGLTLGETSYTGISSDDAILASPYFSNLNSDQYRLTYTGTDNGTLAIISAAVPEPTSSMLGLMGLVAFTLRRRRK